MKTAASVSGVLLLLIGCVWVLQGTGVLPGSFMSGQIRWAVYGGVAAVVGAVLLITNGVKRIVANTVAALLLIVGSIWFLQGIGALPGSFMSGQRIWAIYGAIAVALSLVIYWANRRSR